MNIPNPFRRTAPDPGAFWTWFVANEAACRAIQTGQEPIIQELSKKLQPFGVVWEMSAGSLVPKEFIISADGLRDRIPAVQNLVNAAPHLPGWKFIAFRPRAKDPAGVRLHLSGREAGGLDVWFRAKKRADHVDLDLFLPNPKDTQLIGMAMLLMDAYLGEYTVMTRIGGLEWLALPVDPVRDGLQRLDELGVVVDALLSN